MKIQKGHYVPKELITSEAVHEAVVKSFVAAGFIDGRPEYGDYENIHATGLCALYGDLIIWVGNISCEMPLTLQQLFTAENGLQWPDFATEIRADDNAVWFFGGGQAEHICGSIQPIPHRVLAIRQPKEKDHIVKADEMVSDWWDYENDCLISQPPVGETVLMPPKYDDKSHATVVGGYEYDVVFYSHRTGTYFGDRADRLNVKPLDHATRKAELERNKFINAGLSSFDEISDRYPPASNDWLKKLFGDMFDAGFAAPKADK